MSLSAARQIANHHPLAIQPLIKNSNMKNIPNFPPEIIRIILSLIKDDKKTINTCATVNHTFNLHATLILYHTIPFSFPYIFTLFAKAIISEFQPTLQFRRSITPEILLSILRSCTMLETFSVSEMLTSTINLEVLQVLVFESEYMGRLRFIQDYEDDDKKADLLIPKYLQRLSLHNCSIISEYSTILTLFANAPNITHLDLGGCSVSEMTLN
ncbi:11311_t:CDS:2, partial [Funneliformis caledonium]